MPNLVICLAAIAISERLAPTCLDMVDMLGNATTRLYECNVSVLLLSFLYVMIKKYSCGVLYFQSGDRHRRSDLLKIDYE